MSVGFSSSYIALWALVVFQGLVVLALLQRLEKLQLLASQRESSENRLPNGSRAPGFACVDKWSNREYGLRDLAERGGMLLFLSSDCPACKALVEGLTRAAPDGLPLIIAFCHGREKACARFSRRLETKVPLVVDGAAEIASRYRASGFPTAVGIDRELKIRGYGHPKDVKEIRELWSHSFTEALAGEPRETTSSEMLSTI
ncbi:MAG TPA: redoxin domain-containing protein [Terriglobales bacterium]|nr:redoxin domain-containing protein [Terriglobales bacterium]